MSTVTNAFQHLVERIRTGDDSAMSDLMHQHGAAIRRTAEKLIGKALQSQLDSADLVQSVQIVLWLGLRTGKFAVATPENLYSLAKTLLRRKVARYWRAVKPLTDATICDVSLNDTAVDQAFYPARETAASAQQNFEFDDVVENFLTQLSDLDRQLIKLRFQGFTTAEAARHLNLDPGFLRVRLGRLRKRFAEFRHAIVPTPQGSPQESKPS